MSVAARPLLSVNNIEVIYDHVILVLKGVSLQVPEEGIVALLGANGAGKSTTLKAISGLLRTERGEVTKGGVELDGEAIHRRAAALMGINLSRVTALSFAGGAGAAGLAGLLVSPNISAHYLMGVPLAIQGFTALVIGGVGRVEGALLGGLLLAFAEQFTARYAPIASGYTQGVPLLLLMVFLLVRPAGLLRAREAKA